MGGSAAHIISSMLPPVIAPAGSRSVGNNRTRCGTDQPTGNCGASRPACQATDERAAATADQCTAENPVLSGTTRTAGECQSHRNHDQDAVHLVLLYGYFGATNWQHRNCVTEDRALRQMNTVAV